MLEDFKSIDKDIALRFLASDMAEFGKLTKEAHEKLLEMKQKYVTSIGQPIDQNTERRKRLEPPKKRR
jgi:hypothetical protein